MSAIACDMIAGAVACDDDTVVVSCAPYAPIRFSIYDTSMREREKGKAIALVRGVLHYFRMNGYSFGGFRVYMQSEIFRDAEISFAAAFEILIAEIVNRLYLDGSLAELDKAKAGTFAENHYFGKQSGLLDQCGIAFGGLSKIDFLSDEPLITKLPSIEGYRIVMVNANRSGAAVAMYNEAVKREMGEVAACFQKSVLGEVDEMEFREKLPQLRNTVSDRALLRAIHFFDECKRVDRAAQAVIDGNTAFFLENVRLSGESSLKYLQTCYVAGERDLSVPLALNLSERYIRDGAFCMTGGECGDAILAFCSEGEIGAYCNIMARVFGEDSVFVTRLRPFGTMQLQIK